MSCSAQLVPCRMLTTTTGKSAMTTVTRRRKRSDQPLSSGIALAALSSGGLGRVWRDEPVKLRHDLMRRISLRRALHAGQGGRTVQRGQQRLAGARNAALHGAYGAIANRRRRFIGEPACADQNERFPLLVGERTQRPGGIRKLGRRGLFARCPGNPFCRILVPGGLPPGAPAVRIELVAQDREEPGLQIRAGCEHAPRLPGLNKRFLRQIVGCVRISAERTRKRAQEWNQLQQPLLELRIGVAGSRGTVRQGIEIAPGHFSTPGSLSSSILRRRSRNSSGTGSRVISSYMRRSSRPMARCLARIARFFTLSGLVCLIASFATTFPPRADAGCLISPTHLLASDRACPLADSGANHTAPKTPDRRESSRSGGTFFSGKRWDLGVQLCRKTKELAHEHDPDIGAAPALSAPVCEAFERVPIQRRCLRQGLVNGIAERPAAGYRSAAARGALQALPCDLEHHGRAL